MMGQLPPALNIAPLEVPPNATVRLPGSKSITNRALLCAALAAGETTLTGALFADDTEAMVEAVRLLGAEVSCRPGEATMRIRGTKGAVRATPGAVIDARMSGTTGRFLAPVLALSEQPVTLDGHPQLRARPFGDMADVLRRLGARVEFPSGGDGLPIRICGPIRSRDAAVATDRSSQFLSGLMLAGPLVPGGLTLRVDGLAVSRSYVEMTAAVMRSFGAAVEIGPDVVRVSGDGYTPVEHFAVEPDASSASYFWAAAAITSGTVVVEGLGADSIQGDARFASLLQTMGATMEEVAGCTRVTGGPLQGVEVDMADMSDTAPTLGRGRIAGCNADDREGHRVRAGQGERPDSRRGLRTSPVRRGGTRAGRWLLGGRRLISSGCPGSHLRRPSHSDGVRGAGPGGAGNADREPRMRGQDVPRLLRRAGRPERRRERSARIRAPG